MQDTSIYIDYDMIALIEADKQMIAEAEIRLKNKPPLTLKELLEKISK
jgi:hypothetical protein